MYLLKFTAILRFAGTFNYRLVEPIASQYLLRDQHSASPYELNVCIHTLSGLISLKSNSLRCNAE